VGAGNLEMKGFGVRETQRVPMQPQWYAPRTVVQTGMQHVTCSCLPPPTLSLSITFLSRRHTWSPAFE
jgi:hypothetical protein